MTSKTGAACVLVLGMLLAGCASSTTAEPTASSVVPLALERTDKIVLAQIQPDDGVEAVTGFIDGARKSLDIAIYQIDPDYAPLMTALRSAKARGVKIRILMSGTIYPPSADNANPGLADQLRLEGFDAQLSRPEFSFSHWKTLIRDAGTVEAAALICDFNLGAGYFGIDPEFPTEGATRGMAVLDTDQADVDFIASTFAADWPPYAPWPANTRPNLVWSPSDTTCDSASCTGEYPLEPAGNSRDAMIALIQGSRETLDVYVQALAKPSVLLQPLIDAAMRGVRLRILGNEGGINTDALAELESAGAVIHQNPTDPDGDGRVMYIHTKTVISDAALPDAVAYVGSINPFLDESLQTERELGVFVTNRASIDTIRGVFDRDFDSGSPP